MAAEGMTRASVAEFPPPQADQSEVSIRVDQELVSLPETERPALDLEIDLRPVQRSDHRLGHGSCDSSSDQRCHNLIRFGQLTLRIKFNTTSLPAH